VSDAAARSGGIMEDGTRQRIGAGSAGQSQSQSREDPSVAFSKGTDPFSKGKSYGTSDGDKRAGVTLGGPDDAAILACEGAAQDQALVTPMRAGVIAATGLVVGGIVVAALFA